MTERIDNARAPLLLAPGFVPASGQPVLRARLLSVCLAIILLFVVACDSENAGQAEITVLRIGILPDQSSEVLVNQYTPLFEFLAGQLKIPYQFVASKTYAELLEQFVAGRIDLVYFGGLTFLQAQIAARAIPLVMRDVDTKFTSSFLIRADVPATDITYFEGKRFSFGSQLSTSGHLMPRYFLLTRGIQPEGFFGEVRYSGAHDRTAFEVRDGLTDLGAANAHIVRSMFADGRLKRDDVRVLWDTPPYPNYVWAIRRDIHPALRRRILDAFLELSTIDANHARILERMNASAFLPAHTDDFTSLRSIAKKMGLLVE